MKIVSAQFAGQQYKLELPTQATLNLWWRRHLTRQQLRQMRELDPGRLRDDLGLSDIELAQECRKWFWEE